VTSLLRNGAQKLLGILITIGEAVAYVLSGMYGSVSQLGTGNAILIILQLFFAGIIVDVWTNFFRKVMVWDLAFLCSLLPISVRISSGRRLAPQLSTVAVALNLKGLSLHCSIC
jgi:hypothetical protein